MFDNIDENPAYGMLSFHRVSGGDPNLFGSSVKHNQKIMLTLKEGHVTREINHDWYGGRNTLFEVEMSYTQFAELISAMNVGDGVPVTIRFIKGQGHIEGIQTNNKRTQFLHEFKDKNDESSATAKELIAKLKNIFSEKRTIKAAEREQILDMLIRLYNAVNSHNTFMLNEFDEAMEKVTTEAKGEVEAFVQNKMNSIALATLNQNTIDLNTQEPIKLIEESTNSEEKPSEEEWKEWNCRVTEIESILDNNLRDDPEEIKELQKELDELQALIDKWSSTFTW